MKSWKWAIFNANRKINIFKIFQNLKFAKINPREMFKILQFAKINPREISKMQFAKINPRENLSSRKLILAKIYPFKVIKNDEKHEGTL